MNKNTIEVGVAVLTESEALELADLETTIQAGLERFYEVGTALARIRDAKLYREGFTTFEEYVRERWRLKRRRAYQLMQAAGAASAIPPGDRPQVEAHARILAAIPDDFKAAVARVVREVVERDDRQATQRDYESAVRSYFAVAATIATTGAIDDGTGEMRAWSDLTPPEREGLIRANMLEETYERMQRHKAAGNAKGERMMLPRGQVAALRELAGYAPELERRRYEERWRDKLTLPDTTPF